MLKSEYMTYVPRELVLDSNTSGFDIMTYNICQMYGNNFFKDPIYVTSSFIAGQFGNLLNYRTKAASSLAYLSDKYPDFLGETELSRTYKLNINKKVSEKMVRVSYSDIETILNSKYSYKFELIKLFYIIMASMKSDIEHYKGTNYGSGWYAEYMGVTKKTISLYISCLKELKLIFLFQDKAKKNNLIGRYEDRELLRGWALQNGYTGGSRSFANEARSLMMKYHQLEKGRKYSTNEVQQIKEYVSWYNSNCEPGNEKDMSVFDCYLT